MASINLLIGVSLIYVAFLFGVAFAAERIGAGHKRNWLRSPLVYTLSLSIYCTAWTLYGAVGYAARSGMEFITIYIGPSLVMIGWWWILRKLVRVGRKQKVTSIADLISSRFGKSNTLAILATIMAVIGVTPYIALQLQSVTLSISTFTDLSDTETTTAFHLPAGFWVALGLALFTVLFGTRNLNVNERHDGIVIAIALEAIVKLVALVAVGIFVVWGIAGGVGEMMQRIDASEIGDWNVDPSRWSALIFLSGAAFLCLPRMFQVLVVENEDERHLQIAAWAFPIYLMLISLFVVPIAVIGLDILPEGSNPDLFVLTVPLSQGREGLAILSFLGGFSSATSMVIVATLALSTMVSNHIVMPIWLSFQERGGALEGDVRHIVIVARRLSILGIIALGYVYFRLSGGGGALAAIGLISFIGVAQFLPAMLGGIFWRGATRTGALLGLLIGFCVWIYCALLPSFGIDAVLSQQLMDMGPLGIQWLRPYALFGIQGIDPTVHAVLWSLLLNSFAFIFGSLITFPKPLERLQGVEFVNVFEPSSQTTGWGGTVVQAKDLLMMGQRILGADEAYSVFEKQAKKQGKTEGLPDPTPEFLHLLEREMAATVGAATAHAMIGQLVGGASVSVEDLIAVADESAQILEYSNRLETQSKELSRSAEQLREANEKLTELAHQKDAFLSQISHELRTPMTSIRSFSEILRDFEGLSPQEKKKYAGIIHVEACRLTRLLDDLLDLSVLENGQVAINRETGLLRDVIEHSILSTKALDNSGINIEKRFDDQAVTVHTDLDRLAQVFINLISNAQKYCDASFPNLEIRVQQTADQILIRFCDNGSIIPIATRSVIFEKFSRLNTLDGKGAGLGLAICREIMLRLGGEISYIPSDDGNVFEVRLPQ